jgi:hypothetical protein
LIPTDKVDLPSHNPVTPSPPQKRKRRQVDASKNTNLPKEVQLKESGCIHIIIEGWPELLNSDKEFVTAWNSRAKHGESTKDITIPTGVNLIPYARGATATFLKQIRRQPTATRSCRVVSETGLPPIEIIGYGSTGPLQMCKVANEDQSVLFVLNRVCLLDDPTEHKSLAIPFNFWAHGVKCCMQPPVVVWTSCRT